MFGSCQHYAVQSVNQYSVKYSLENSVDDPIIISEVKSMFHETKPDVIAACPHLRFDAIYCLSEHTFPRQYIEELNDPFVAMYTTCNPDNSLNIYVGSSTDNIKTVYIQLPVGSININNVTCDVIANEYSDTFDASISPVINTNIVRLTVRRTDVDAGWGQALKVKLVLLPSLINKYDINQLGQSTMLSEIEDDTSTNLCMFAETLPLTITDFTKFKQIILLSPIGSDFLLREFERTGDNTWIRNDLINSTGLVVDQTPKVLITILAKNKEHCLPYYLKCLDNLIYPTQSIGVYIRSNNNTDQTETMLRNWVTLNKSKYIEVFEDYTNVEAKVEDYAEHEWNAVRFDVLGKIRQESLDYCLASSNNYDYYFVIDCDNYIKPHCLDHLVKTAHNNRIALLAPYLTNINGGYYSNYHHCIDESGYCKNCDHYYAIFDRHLKGIIEVNVIHCTYLVDSRIIPNLHYLDGSGRHEYVIFSESCRNANIQQFLDNSQRWGYVSFYNPQELIENIDKFKIFE